VAVVNRLALLGIGLGLTLALSACSTLPGTYVVLMPDEDGKVGHVELRGEGTQTVEQARAAAGFDAARGSVSLSQSQIERTFEPALAALPERPAHYLLYFRSDTTELRPESRALLPEALAEAGRRPAGEIAVVGHTDREAPAEYNARLALRRAEMIRDELIALGARPEMIEVRSHGENDPLVPTPDGAREPRNRRVELSVR
jgi:outer membrane protein OmpA-like peptidoglycan-associated protein